MKKRSEKYLWHVTFSVGGQRFDTLILVTKSRDPRSVIDVFDAWLKGTDWDVSTIENETFIDTIDFQGEIKN